MNLRFFWAALIVFAVWGCVEEESDTASDDGNSNIDECSLVGIYGCRGATRLYCAEGSNRRVWVEADTCSQGCSNGLCLGNVQCADECPAEGVSGCSGSRLYICLRGDGCRKFAFVTDCPWGCDDGVCNAGCVRQCSGKECGDDGCGGNCGTCGDDEECLDGRCESIMACVPKCVGKKCGDDGCNGKCGVCAEGSTCKNGECVVGSTYCTDCRFDSDCTQSFGSGYRCDTTSKVCIEQACRYNAECVKKVGFPSYTKCASIAGGNRCTVCRDDNDCINLLGQYFYCANSGTECRESPCSKDIDCTIRPDKPVFSQCVFLTAADRACTICRNDADCVERQGPGWVCSQKGTECSKIGCETDEQCRVGSEHPAYSECRLSAGTGL